MALDARGPGWPKSRDWTGPLCKRYTSLSSISYTHKKHPHLFSVATAPFLVLRPPLPPPHPCITLPVSPPQLVPASHSAHRLHLLCILSYSLGPRQPVSFRDRAATRYRGEGGRGGLRPSSSHNVCTTCVSAAFSFRWGGSKVPRRAGALPAGHFLFHLIACSGLPGEAHDPDDVAAVDCENQGRCSATPPSPKGPRAASSPPRQERLRPVTPDRSRPTAASAPPPPPPPPKAPEERRKKSLKLGSNILQPATTPCGSGFVYPGPDREE